MLTKKNNKGLTLIELLITLGLISMMLSVVFLLYSFGYKSFVLADNKHNAKFAANRTAAVISQNLRLATEVTVFENVPAAQENYYMIYLQSGKIKYKDGNNAAQDLGNYDVNFQSVQFTPGNDGNNILEFSLTAEDSNKSYTLIFEVFLVNLAHSIPSNPASGSVVRFRKLPAATTNLAIDSGTPTSAYIDTVYSYTLSSSGGTTPYTYSTSSGLPSGLTLSNAGLISGTPTQSGNYTFTITVTDNTGNTASKTYTMTVYSKLSFNTNSFSDGYVGEDYSAALSASGGTGSYSYILVSGSLPAGLAINGAALSGSPSAEDSYSFTIQVADSNNSKVNKTFQINVINKQTTVDGTKSSVDARSSPVSVKRGKTFTFNVFVKNLNNQAMTGLSGTNFIFSSTGGNGALTINSVTETSTPGKYQVSAKYSKKATVQITVTIKNVEIVSGKCAVSVTN